MTGYIRHPANWNTEKAVEVISYDLPLTCCKGETGSAEILGVLPNYSRYVFSLDGIDAIWIINGVSSSDGKTTNIQLEDGTAICDGAVPGWFTDTLTDSFYFPVGLKDMTQVSANHIYSPDYYETRNMFQPYYRSIRYVNGKDPFFWAAPYESSNQYLAYDTGMRSTIDSMLSGIDYSAAMDPAELTEGTGVIVNPREMLRAVQLTGIDIKYRVVPYVDERLTLKPEDGDGILWNGSVYKVGWGSGSRIGYAPCSEIDPAAPVIYESLYAPVSGIQYLFRLSDLRLKNKPARTWRQVYDDRSELQLSLVDRPDFSVPVPIFFNDGHSSVISEDYDEKEVVSKITVFQKDGSDWWSFYLNAEGRADADYHNQVQGAESYIRTDSNTTSSVEARDMCQMEFDNNAAVSSHKVEFWSDKELRIGTPVKLMLERGVLDTVISKVSITSTDKRFKYSCGDIPTSIVDRLQTFKWSYGSRVPMNAKRGSLFVQN